jgi:divalent metal cation (Fe/Co/Zn/Cd) transporter
LGKRKVSKRTNNRALAADPVQSATCAYLAAVTLTALAINAIWHIRWVDSAAAMLTLPILIVEGRRALRGESCGCC